MIPEIPVSIADAVEGNKPRQSAKITVPQPYSRNDGQQVRSPIVQPVKVDVGSVVVLSLNMMLYVMLIVNPFRPRAAFVHEVFVDYPLIHGHKKDYHWNLPRKTQ